MPGMLLAVELLHGLDGVHDLGLDLVVDLPAVLVVLGAGLGGDGEALGDGQANVGHFRQVGALAAEELTHFRVAFGEGVYILMCHVCRFSFRLKRNITVPKFLMPVTINNINTNFPETQSIIPQNIEIHTQFFAGIPESEKNGARCHSTAHNRARQTACGRSFRNRFCLTEQDDLDMMSIERRCQKRLRPIQIFMLWQRNRHLAEWRFRLFRKQKVHKSRGEFFGFSLAFLRSGTYNDDGLHSNHAI